MKKVNILIADPEAIYREGLRLVLQRDRQFRVAGLTAEGAALPDLVHRLQIDVVITDLPLTGIDGLEATRQLRRVNSTVKIIAFTRLATADCITGMVEAGVNGWVAKGARRQELLTAIRQVMAGQLFFCAAAHQSLAGYIRQHHRQRVRPTVVLNQRENDIVRLICQELSSKQIAGALHLAHRTVEKYRERIMQKLEAQNVVGIVLYAIRSGLFTPCLFVCA